MDKTAKVENLRDSAHQPDASSALRNEVYSPPERLPRTDTDAKPGQLNFEPTDNPQKTKSTDGEKTFDSVARGNGLDINEAPGGKLEFSLKYNGEKLVLGNFENNDKGLKELGKALKEFTELKRWELEKTHNIKIARPGDPAPRQQIGSMDGPPKQGKELALREPRLKELLGIEAAMERANPSHKTGDSKTPLKFYFLKNDSFNAEAAGVAAFEPNIHGGPAIIVEPHSLDNSPVTEKDREDPKSENHRSIASLFLHELGHHSEERVFDTPQKRIDFYKRMGWAPIPGTRPEDMQMMLKGKEGGFAPKGLDPDAKWERFDKDGNVTGLVSKEEVARQALIKPATGYFEGPHEMLTEAVTMLRLGDGHRTHLMQTDQTLYNLAKEFDQREIDLNYGAGKFIRSFTGKLVPRNAENEESLRARERR